VVDGVSQGIEPQVEHPLDQMSLSSNAVLDLDSPGLLFLLRPHQLESLEGVYAVFSDWKPNVG